MGRILVARCRVEDGSIADSASLVRGGERYRTPGWILDGFPDEVSVVADQIYADFNEEHGTEYEFQLKR